MIWVLGLLAWSLAAAAIGVIIGKSIALADRDQPLTYDERQALIERSRRRHPANRCPDHVPGGWVA